MKIIWEPGDCSIIVDGTLVGFINPDFANERQIGISEMEMLRSVHRDLHIVKKSYEKRILEENQLPQEMHWSYALIDALDLRLQQLWGFPEDRLQLTHWNTLKGCLCQRHRGLPRGFDPQCPYHAYLIKKENPNGNLESI